METKSEKNHPQMNQKWRRNAIFKHNYYIEFTVIAHTLTEQRTEISQLKAVYCLEEEQTEKY